MIHFFNAGPAPTLKGGDDSISKNSSRRETVPELRQ